MTVSRRGIRGDRDVHRGGPLGIVESVAMPFGPSALIRFAGVR